MLVHKDYKTIENHMVKVPYFDVVCKYCNSHNVIKYGTFRGRQRFWCKDCKRKFADNDALPKMQTPLDQVGTAIGMYYEGQSLNSITNLLTQIYSSYTSDSTVYRWIERFTKQAVKDTKQYTPTVGERWIADETMLDIGGRKLWFWDIIDEKTRFLLASHISRTRTTKDARKLVHAAYKRAGGKVPKVIITDGLRAYQDGIEIEFGGDTRHIQSKPFTETDTTNHIERFHGSLKDRTKVMRGLKDAKSARLILDGWLLHYNFLRKHETLGKTPAEAAGIRYPYHNWQDIVAGQKIITPRQTSATSTIPISKIPSFSDRTKRSHSGRRQARNSRRLTPSVIAGRV